MSKDEDSNGLGSKKGSCSGQETLLSEFPGVRVSQGTFSRGDVFRLDHRVEYCHIVGPFIRDALKPFLV